MSLTRQLSILLLFSLLTLAGLSSCSESNGKTTSTTQEKAVEKKTEIQDEVVKAVAEKAPPKKQAQDLRKQWKGKLDGKIPVTVELQFGDGIAYGTLVYDKVGTPIKLIGMEEFPGNYRIHEMDAKGTITGVWNLAIGEGDVKGNCWFPASKKSMNITLVPSGQGAPVTDLSTRNFSGNFEYSYGENAHTGGFEVIGFEEGNVVFNLTCVTAAPAYHIAAIEEMELPLMGNTLSYRDTEYGECAFDISFYKDFVAIKYIDEKRECGFGHNAFVDGVFLRM